MSLKNGHQFQRSRPPPGHENCNGHDPLEKHAPAARGDWGCVLCGSWTTYCLSAQKADEKMGPCPNRRDREQRAGEAGGTTGGQPQ